jgi:hypothetical protein
MSQPARGEKDEKEVQKRDEKHDEKGEEKHIDEKYHRDPLGTTIRALILVWLGVVLLLDNLGVLDHWQEQGLSLFGYSFQPNFWAVFFFGTGVLVVMEVILRLVLPVYRRPVGGSIVVAAVCFGVSIGFGFDQWAVIGPLVLVAVGLSILLGPASRKKA